MKIYTLWADSGDETSMPWMVSSYDEYTADEHGGTPDWFEKELKEHPRGRVLILEVPDRAVLDLFKAPTVKATAKPSQEPEHVYDEQGNCRRCGGGPNSGTLCECPKENT